MEMKKGLQEKTLETKESIMEKLERENRFTTTHDIFTDGWNPHLIIAGTNVEKGTPLFTVLIKINKIVNRKYEEEETDGGSVDVQVIRNYKINKTEMEKRIATDLLALSPGEKKLFKIKEITINEQKGYGSSLEGHAFWFEGGQNWDRYVVVGDYDFSSPTNDAGGRAASIREEK